jgi:hypothetical protein
MRVRLMGAAAAVALALGLPAAADAVGPSPGVTMGGAGAVWAGHGGRFVTRPSGGSATLILRRGGAGRLTRVVSGRWGIPGVAYDGSTEQVPPASRVVVLAGRGVPFRRSRFLVLSTRTLRPVRSIDLRGSWAFDALSPDGRTMYLIQRRTTNLIAYDVRAFDLRAGRLLPGVIADRRIGEWQMQGAPMVRLQRPGSNWSYTLYTGGQEGAFVHALDTATATARCIDLPGLADDLSGARLRLAGDRLLVMDGAVRVAAIDTRTLVLAHAHSAVPVPAVDVAGKGTDWTTPALAVLALACLAAGGVGVRRRMPHNPARDRRA